VTAIRPASAETFLERLEEEIPARWLRKVEGIFVEGNVELPASGGHAPAQAGLGATIIQV
jgi:hypothetical protein